jgi:hypothetical protein
MRHTFAFSRLAPELCSKSALFENKGRREGRVPACTRSPVCGKERARGGRQVTPDIPAFPARMVLTVSFVLSSGSVALLPPSPRRCSMRAPVGRHITTRLDARTPGVGTTRLLRPRTVSPIVRGWPCTPRPRRAAVTAPCRSRGARTHGCPPCPTLLRADAAASTAPRPAPRDDREAPLWQGRDERHMPQIRNSEKENIFAARD